MPNQFGEAPWIVNERRTSSEGFYYDEFGYKADRLFWADEMDLDPIEVAELQRRILIKNSLDQGLDDQAVETKHGSIPQDLLDHYNAYFRPYRPSVDSLRLMLLQAVDRFNAGPDRRGLLFPTDGTNRGAAASERAVAHRLACHLEQVLKDAKIVSTSSPISVDCEYNRHRGKTKSLLAKTEEIAEIVRSARRKIREAGGDGSNDSFAVSPDIVVHHRGTDQFNLIVIELKMATSKESADYDLKKLELFTGAGEDGYNYRLGAEVLVLDDLEPSDRRLTVNTIRCLETLV
jgi:hypothetical protein